MRPCRSSRRPSSGRLFSLHVPVPPKIFLSLVYKLEGPSAVEVALELTTGDAGSCHVGGLWTLDGERRRALASCGPSVSGDALGKRLESVPGCGGAGAGQRTGDVLRAAVGQAWTGRHGSAAASGPQPPLGSMGYCVGLGPCSSETWGTGLLPAVALRPWGGVWGGSLPCSPSPPRPQPVWAGHEPWHQQGVCWPLGLTLPPLRSVDTSLRFPLDSSHSQVLGLLPQQKPAQGTAPDLSGCPPPSWPDGWAAAANSSLGAGSSGESFLFLLGLQPGRAACWGRGA